ncbi:UNVERIFIED_CONTAM: hypothetical protein Slati_0837200 [Sesamum latifolium]|uniref:Uncharacterized protein n=1 Tax=Sesamum latifolium TaxID=2727402 RepID=A0AAW2XT43_9LAMI
MPLVGFGGSEVIPKGTIDLSVSIVEEPTRRTCMVQFFVVDDPFAYDVVLGRLGLNMFQAVVSTYHLKIKFPTKGGIGEVRCDQREARQCYNLSIKCNDLDNGKEKGKDQGGKIDEAKKMRPERIELVEGYKEIELMKEDPSKTTRVG